MNLTWLDMLAQGDDGSGFGSLAYVVALLILSVAGAVIDKFKQKADENRRKTLPKPGPRPTAREDADSPPASRSQPVSRDVPQRPTPRARPEPPADQRRRPARPAPGVSPPRQPQARPAAPRPPRSRPAETVIIAQAVENAQSRPQRQLGSLQQVTAQPEAVPSAAKSRSSTAGMSALRGRASQTGDVKLMGRRLDRAELRRAIVLNELLQPPLALRDRTQSL